VICYDFLWKHEYYRGQSVGRKDRPCAIALAVKSDENGSKSIFLVPITHSTPTAAEENTSIKVPIKVARHLGLDDQPCWIKTHELNYFIWRKGHLPAGVIPIHKNKFCYGQLPDALMKQIISLVDTQANTKTIKTVKREST